SDRTCPARWPGRGEGVDPRSPGLIRRGAASLRSTAATRTRAASWPGSVGAGDSRAQDVAERARREPDAHVERPEERVARARRVEAHLVHELLEDERVVGEERDAPFPVVEADRARDHLRHAAG